MGGLRISGSVIFALEWSFFTAVIAQINHGIDEVPVVYCIFSAGKHVAAANSTNDIIL